MKNNIFIPTKINVGFQEREDTYTKKLAYVVYTDQAGKLRKEASWNSWRDKDIEPVEFDNIPTSGFVLNKKAGGYDTGWNHRQTYCRVYDSRGFEFEITIPNLLYILENTNSIKGKGLEGEFVYGWDGKDLILIPTSSPDYEQLSKFNKIVHNNEFIKVKDLVVGATYMSKDNCQYVYMGKYDYYDSQYRTFENGEYKWYKKYKELPIVNKRGGYWGSRIDYEYKVINCGKAFFFLIKDDGGQFVHKKSINKLLVSTIDENCIDEYADLFDRLEHYRYYSPIDDSKDVITPYTFDEFASIISERENTHSHYHWYPTFHDEAGKSLNLYKDGTQYKLEYNGDTMSLEDIFNHIRPVHLDKYLENNKFYQRSY